MFCQIGINKPMPVSRTTLMNRYALLSSRTRSKVDGKVGVPRPLSTPAPPLKGMMGMPIICIRMNSSLLSGRVPSMVPTHHAIISMQTLLYYRIACSRSEKADDVRSGPRHLACGKTTARALHARLEQISLH